MDRKTAGYIKRFLSQEAKLRGAFTRLDSNAAKNLFMSDPQATYRSFLSRTSSDSLLSRPRLAGGYLPYVDSLQGILSFMKQGSPMTSLPAPGQLSTATTAVGKLESSLQKDELVRAFILERKEQIKSFLSQQTKVPSEIQSIYQNYNKELFYYNQQLADWKQSLNDPARLEQTALQVLNKVPAFSSFMQKHSFLSGLTGASEDYNMENSLAGLQSKESVNKLLDAQVSDGGQGATAALSQNLQGAQAQLDALKNKVQSLGAGGAASADLPASFQPNPEKTHTFGQRLQLGFDLQTTSSTSYFPVTSAAGLSLGYKLNSKSTIGAGIAYRVGWGQDIDHIHFTSQGIGLRSYMDMKIKKTWGVTGGFEYNYQQPFTSLQNLRNISAWTRSGLIGVSKTIAMHSKFFKNAQVKLLWDFLSYQQVPQTQPLLFRIGYTL